MKVIYIRTSTDEQNPELQLKDIKTLSGEDVSIYMDKQSAWKEDKERPDFERLKKDIKSGKVKELFVWDLDRLYRNRIKLKEFFLFCKTYKTIIFSYRQKWLQDINKIPNPFNEIVFDLLLNIFGWIGEEESSKKSERIRNAIRIKEDGVYSYKGNKWGRKQLSSQKKNKLIECLNRNPKPTIRQIAQEVGISLGVVHKYSQFLQYQNSSKKDSSQLTNL